MDSRRGLWTFSPRAGSDLAAAAVPWLGAAPLVASPPATVQASQTRHQSAVLMTLEGQLGHSGHHAHSHTSDRHTWNTAEDAAHETGKKVQNGSAKKPASMQLRLLLIVQETLSFLQHFTLLSSPRIAIVFSNKCLQSYWRNQLKTFSKLFYNKEITKLIFCAAESIFFHDYI